MSSPSAISDPVYIPSSGRWLVAISGLNVGACTEIWKSDDGGLTWSQLKVLGGTTRNVAVGQLAVLDPLIVGLTGTGQPIVYSSDAGATWYVGPVVGTAGATAPIHLGW